MMEWEALENIYEKTKKENEKSLHETFSWVDL